MSNQAQYNAKNAELIAAFVTAIPPSGHRSAEQPILTIYLSM